MQPNLLKSRKFWLMIVDLVVSVGGYFVGKYVNPESAKDVLFLIGAMQPVVIAVIASITVQNLEGQRVEAALKINDRKVEADLKEAELYRKDK